MSKVSLNLFASCKVAHFRLCYVFMTFFSLLQACPDSTCEPANPGIGYCEHKYRTTGVPCQFFTCDDYDPCIATTCPVGAICQVVNGVAECVCDEPTYLTVGYTCLPNSCDAVNACPADTACTSLGLELEELSFSAFEFVCLMSHVLCLLQVCRESIPIVKTTVRLLPA